MSKKKVEKELKETNKKADIIIVDDMVTEKKKFTNIKKLKCDYTTYKEERTKYNMPVETNCSKCGKDFKAGEEIYTAFEEGKQGSCIICGNCVSKKKQFI